MTDKESIDWTLELIKGVITFGAVLLGGWVALINYYSQKWWDAKLDAYHEVMRALEECANYHSVINESGSYVTPIFPDSATKERFEAARVALRQRENCAKFMLSDAARKVLEDLRVNLSGICDYMPQREQAADLIEFYNKALVDFIFQARVDLKVAGPYARFQHRVSVVKARICHWYRTSPRFRFCCWCFWLGDNRGSKERRRYTLGGTKLPDAIVEGIRDTR